MATLECRIEISAPPEVVFDLARDIDAHLRSQANAGEREVAGVTSGLIGPGESVTWRATHFRVPFKITSRITQFERPMLFVDEQESGPFRRFRHEHRFEQSPSGTTMIDHLQFDAPLGFVGRFVDRLLLDRYMRRLIEDRAQALKSEAENQTD